MAKESAGAIQMADPFEISMFTTQFTTTFELLLQQEVSRLRGLVDSKGYVNNMPLSGPATAPLVKCLAPAGRYSPLQFQSAQCTHPWVFPTLMAELYTAILTDPCG